MYKKLNLIFRKIMFKLSKKDMNAVLKYDPLNILK